MEILLRREVEHFAIAAHSVPPLGSMTRNEQMKKHHWGGVLIELVIVIVGVFIGLQVNNWNQARSDARHSEDGDAIYHR